MIASDRITQNVHDDPEFFEGYARLGRSVEGLAGVDAQGRKTWPIDGDFAEGPRTTDWLAKGAIKHHRTVGTMLDRFIRSGFAVSQVEEICPAEAQIAANPVLGRPAGEVGEPKRRTLKIRSESQLTASHGLRAL